jgi:predicted metal-binding membrane protein
MSGMSAAQSLVMGTAMMVAMMIPPLIPLLARYRRSMPGARGLRRHGLTFVAMLGYLTFWAAAGLVLCWLAARMTPPLRWTLLLLAGAVQLSAWKRHQLALRRPRPQSAEWRRVGVHSALWHGVQLGVRSCLCCGNLMLALVAVGAMDPVAMLAATVVITAEPLVPARR